MCTRTDFSKLKCKNKQCSHVEPSSAWRCRCRLLWIKCPRHIHYGTSTTVKKAAREPTLKARRIAIYGVDRPMPVERQAKDLDQSKGLYSHRRATWRTGDDSTSPSEADNGYDDDTHIVTTGDTRGRHDLAEGAMPPGNGPSASTHAAGASPTIVGPSNEQLSEAASDARKIGSEATSIGNPISEYRRRKNRELKSIASVPETSLARFRESFSRSNASDALKARFAKLRRYDG